MTKEIGTIEEALRDIKEGKVILVIDDPDRENEGDLICAAEFATPENPNAGGRAILRFWQAEYRADVWLNGKPLGAHEGGEEKFELDVKYTENVSFLLDISST